MGVGRKQKTTIPVGGGLTKDFKLSIIKSRLGLLKIAQLAKY